MLHKQLLSNYLDIIFPSFNFFLTPSKHQYNRGVNLQAYINHNVLLIYACCTCMKVFAFSFLWKLKNFETASCALFASPSFKHVVNYGFTPNSYTAISFSISSVFFSEEVK